jgi:hydrogenase/urease accessory protein HupE
MPLIGLEHLLTIKAIGAVAERYKDNLVRTRERERERESE